MDPNWFNALVGLASFLTLLTSLLIGYLFRISKELSEYKIYVARYHPTKDELTALTERLERRVDTGFGQIMAVLKQRDAA